jgi:hypothetical protein
MRLIRKPALVAVGMAVNATVLLFAVNASRAADVVWTGNAGDNNWNTGNNWTGNLVPEAQFEEVGAINNGNTAFIAAVVPNAAGLVLGQGASDTGGLEIRSGGSIGFVDSTGAPDGSIIVGQGGQGTLVVKPGGTATGTSLTVNGQSSLTIGSTAAGVASLSVSGPVTLDGATRVVGAGQTFSGTSVALGGTGTLISQITSANHSPIRSTAGATVSGGFKLEFGNGYNPIVGDKWNIIDASTISGAFANVDLSAVAAPPSGTTYQFATINGGTNGRLLQLQLNARIQLTVNTDTGAVSMSSPSGVSFSINGYTIKSSGLFNTAQWNSLQDQSVAGWQEASPTSSNLSELNANIGGSLTIGTSPVNLGTPYTTPAAFGTAPNVQFKYSSITDNDLVVGLVKYTGGANYNNLLLTIDPATGNAQLNNNSKTSIPLVGYSILSASGSLLPGNGDWLSLDDQNIGSWLEANPTSTALNEVFAGAGATTLTPGQTINLGGLFNEVSGSRDLVLQFGLNGELTPRYGVVQYATIAGLSGDYNNNNKADAPDYVMWRKNPAGFGGDPAGYNTWRSNFGQTAGSGSALSSASVPEPAAWLILLIGAGGAGSVLRRSSRLLGNAG